MKARVKPAEVEAVRVDPEALHPFAEAMKFTKELGDIRTVHIELGSPVWLSFPGILGQTVVASLGDWVVKTPVGKFQAYTDEVFKSIYEIIP